MHRIPLLAVGLILSLGAASPSLSAQQPDATGDLVIKMQPCKLRRALEPFFVFSSKTLVLKGTVNSDGKDYDIYLPRDRKNNYSNAPRPKRKKLAATLTSSYLAVDQNHDGKIETWESYYSEFPLRIGNKMFDVRSIAKDGTTITLRPSDSPLSGAFLGQLASDFMFTTTKGRKVKRQDFAGKVVVIDRWAPS